jgi:uncharacterized membrane protein
MAFTLLSLSERVAVLGGAVVLAALAFALGRRPGRGRWVVLAALGAVVLAGIAIAELMIALALSAAAPASADFNEYRWVLMAPWGRLGVILGVAAAAVACGLGWWTSKRARTPLERAAMIALRCAAAVAALVLFLQPAVELRQVAREPNHLAVLVDESQSMRLAEDPGGPRRIDRARALLDRSAGALAAWQERHRVDVFGFAEALETSTLEAVARSEPDGRATNIYHALDQVRARYDGTDLAGVILISDGVGTGGLAGGVGAGALRDFLKSLDTRVHTVWTGKSGLRDVAVARVLADEFAFARTVVRVEAAIRATGYGQRRIPVTLSSEGQTMRQKWVDVGPGDSEVPVVFEFTPPRVGKYVYEISTPVAEDEVVAENNRRAFVLRVIRDKIRVLQVAGQPSWDVHALRRMLEENPNVDLISFFILRTQDDFSTVPNDEMSLIPFPTQELFQQELPSFDLIVMQNFEFAPYGIGAYLENIRSYVEGGGGLVMLGGALSFSSGGYAGTPVAAALPVELVDPYGASPAGVPPRLRPGGYGDGDGAVPGQGDPLIDTAPFTPVLTPAGEVHPITALRYERADNLATWKALPPLEGINLVARARPEAVVLAGHPRLRTPGGEPMPVIVAGEYGQGRVLTVATDSLWRWGFVAAARPGDDGRHYIELWENSIRWLIQDPELRHLHVESDAVEYAPDTPVRLSVRLLNRDYAPLAGGAVRLEVQRGTDAAQAETVASEVIQVDDAGRGRTELPRMAPGVYRVTASAELGGRPVTARDIFLVRDVGAELDRPAAQDSLLREISAVTGGTYLGAAEELPRDLPLAEPRIVRVDRRADVELWSRPMLFFLALLFLGAEWGLRQRSGYL